MAISDRTQKIADIILVWNFIEHISCPYKLRSRNPTFLKIDFSISLGKVATVYS